MELRVPIEMTHLSAGGAGSGLVRLAVKKRIIAAGCRLRSFNFRGGGAGLGCVNRTGPRTLNQDHFLCVSR